MILTHVPEHVLACEAVLCLAGRCVSFAFKPDRLQHKKLWAVRSVSFMQGENRWDWETTSVETAVEEYFLPFIEMKYLSENVAYYH